MNHTLLCSSFHFFELIYVLYSYTTQTSPVQASNIGLCYLLNVISLIPSHWARTLQFGAARSLLDEIMHKSTIVDWPLEDYW